MINSELLREKINASGMAITLIANQIGITREAFYKKLNNQTEFKASEIGAVKDILKLSKNERDKIFFEN